LKRNATLTISLAALLLVIFTGFNFFKSRANDLPFRCSAFSRYELSRHDASRIEFAVTQYLRFIDSDTGYLLLNGQVTVDDKITGLNRRIALSQGRKIDSDTYRYKITKMITSTNDSTPDDVFNILLAEITLDPNYLQLDFTRLNGNAYLISGPLSSLFTCQRY